MSEHLSRTLVDASSEAAPRRARIVLSILAAFALSCDDEASPTNFREYNSGCSKDADCLNPKVKCMLNPDGNSFCQTPCASDADCAGLVGEDYSGSVSLESCYTCNMNTAYWSCAESNACPDGPIDPSDPGGDADADSDADADPGCGECGTVGPTSSTCCGFPYCSGDCIGSPCC